MAIMKCPRCGGCGGIVQGSDNTTAGLYKSPCPSCSGTGWVSDAPTVDSNVKVHFDNLKLERAMEDHYMKCPKCGEVIRIELGHYLVLPDSAKKL